MSKDEITHSMIARAFGLPLWSLNKFKLRYAEVKESEPTWTKWQKFYWAFRVAFRYDLVLWYMARKTRTSDEG